MFSAQLSLTKKSRLFTSSHCLVENFSAPFDKLSPFHLKGNPICRSLFSLLLAYQLFTMHALFLLKSSNPNFHVIDAISIFSIIVVITKELKCYYSLLNGKNFISSSDLITKFELILLV